MNKDINQDFIKQMISQFGDAGLNYPGKTATLRVVPIVENEVVIGHAIFVLRGEDPVYFTQIPPIPNLDKYIAQLKQAIDTVDNELFVETTQQIREEVDAYIAENN